MSEHTRLKPKSSLSPTDSFQPAIAPPSSNFSSQAVNTTVNAAITTNASAASQLAAPEQSPEQSIPVSDKVPTGHEFSRFSIYPKLTVSQPNDPAEREGDRVADTVMRTPQAKNHPSHSLQPKLLGHDFSKISIFSKHQPTEPSTSILAQPIQRQCDACEDDEDEHLMRKENSAIVQRDEASSSPSVPGFQLTPPSLLQPPDPASRYNLDLKLHLDPQMQAMAMQHAQQQLDPAALKPTLAQLSLGTLPTISPNSSSASGGATSLVPNPLPAPTPAPTSPAVSSDKEPDLPRAATATDFMKAVLKVPEIDSGLTTLQTRVGDRITQDWQRLSTGEQVGFVSTTVLIGTGALAGVLSDPAARRLALDQLNGQTLPVPGVNWLRLEINTGGDNLMLGMHVDIGRLLPPSLGFGASSPTAIGSPPQPEPAVPGQRMIQRVGSSEGSVQGDIGQRIQSASGSGGKLDEGVQQHLEHNLGADLSSVRIHTDGEADRLSKSVNAIAFTTGQDIFFSSGSYNPNSSEGKHLIAHEVVHTVQQSSGAVAGNDIGNGVSISDPSDAFEQEAERVAGQVMSMPDTATQQPIKRETIPEEDKIHTKRSLQRSPDAGFQAGNNLESRLSSNRGEESLLPDKMRSSMEPQFGSDFSQVHTSAETVQMNRDISAQAFTHKQNIYFGEEKALGKDTLPAHELTHVVQQKWSPTSSVKTTSFPKIQRWAGSEHKKLGDVTNITLDLGNGVILTWGQVVAIGGDEFGSLDDLMKQVETPEGKAQIRFALEHAGVPGNAVKTLPAPTGDQQSQAETRYITLAAQNVSHFAAGGTALENWYKYHAEAVDKALRAGLAEDLKQLNVASLSEAFGQHYLTDMFSGGHVRTPRKQIIEWYTGVFAPKVIDTLINNLRTRMVNEVYSQVSAQSRTARIFESKAREKIRTGIDQQMNEAIARLGNGRVQLIQYFGLAIAGIISGAIHDMEGKRGVVVSSKAHPESWKAMGDGSLDSKDNETNKAQAETAVLTALQDVNTAYQIGLHENQTKKSVPQRDKLPSRILFKFNSDALTPDAQANLTSAAAYMIHNPTTHLDLVGHTDPIGKEDYNQSLGLRRATAISHILSNQGVAASQFSTSSQGEKQLLEINPRGYAQNRRVEFTWSTPAPTNDTTSHDIAWERAQDAVETQIGPPYEQVERLLPETVPGQNLDLPDWHWGSLPPEFQQEVGNWVKGYLDKELQTKILNSQALDPVVIEENTIQPRPIVEGLLRDLLSNPVGFLSTSFGEAAGPSK